MTAIDATGWTPEQHAEADQLAQLDAMTHHADAAAVETIREPLPDYPLSGVLDMLESAIVTVRTVEDQLREHSRFLVPTSDAAAFDALIKKAYITAENDAVSALAVLQHAAQLVRGLAR